MWSLKNKQGTCSQTHLHATAHGGASLNLSEISTCSAVLITTHTPTHMHMQTKTSHKTRYSSVVTAPNPALKLLLRPSKRKTKQLGNIYNTTLWATFALPFLVSLLWRCYVIWALFRISSCSRCGVIVPLFFEQAYTQWNWFTFINKCPGML